MYLADGDISKRAFILWHTTPEDSKEYLKYKVRDVLFRESVLGFLGVPQDAGNMGESCNKKQCEIEFGENIDWACKNCEKSKRGK